ncbi:MAG: cytochrome c [Cyclobacteriaceae bacterium]|nr:cytochrome c [Cyclobacteriaceae bacterium]
MDYKYLLIFCIVLLLTGACTFQSGDERRKHLSSSEKIRITQYVNNGRVLYEQHCSNCHQSDGRGLARLYPPLKNSDYLRDDVHRAVCIIKYGIKGEILVNGDVYNMPMEGIADLKDLEIAEIATYILNVFADTVALVSAGDVRNYLQNCQSYDQIQVKK